MIDVVLDDFDLDIKNGDFVLGESTEQHLSLLLLAEKGEWREVPYLGVGVRSFLLEDAQPIVLKKEIRKQVQLDGARLVKLKIENKEVEIAADYSA